MYKKHAFNNFLLFFYFFSSILEKLKWNIGGWSCDFFTLLTPAFFLYLVLLHISRRKTIRINSFIKAILFFFLVYFMYLILQLCFISKDTVITTQYLKGIISTFLQFMSFLNIVMFFNYSDNSITMYSLQIMMLVVTMINTIYCIVQSINPNIDQQLVELFNSDTIRYGLDSYGSIGRITGLFFESNFNAAFMVIGIANEIYIIKNKLTTNKISKIIVVICLLLTSLECFLSFSLTSLFGLFVLFAFLFVKSDINNKLLYIILFLIAFLVLVKVYSDNEQIRYVINAKFSIFKDTNALENSSHFRIAKESLTIYKQDLSTVLFGTGINCLNVYFQRMFGYTMMKAHSYYLQNLCELGLIGLVISLYYIYILIKYSKKNKTTNGFFVFLMIIITLSMNITYDPFTRNYNIVLFMFSLAAYNSKNNLFNMSSNKSIIICDDKGKRINC